MCDNAHTPLHPGCTFEFPGAIGPRGYGMKKPISSNEAAIYLQGAFTEAQQSTCRTCQFPASFWGPAAAGTGAGYWYLKMPPSCPHGCVSVIARLWAAFTTEYEIQREPYDAGSHREQRTLFPRQTSPRDARFARVRRQNER